MLARVSVTLGLFIFVTSFIVEIPEAAFIPGGGTTLGAVMILLGMLSVSKRRRW